MELEKAVKAEARARVADQKAAKMRLGWKVGAGLAALTVVEYIVAVALTSPLPYLTLIALVKAWLIVQYFMHIYHLWQGKGGEH